jgi:hypothetical protein
MKDREKIAGVLDGKDAFPDFLDPKWKARQMKKLKQYEEEDKRAASGKRPKAETAKGQ